MLLPCHNLERAVRQVQPTKELLTGMDRLYPDILRQHDIVPADYHGGLVFRSAVESIRGTYIASASPERERMVGTALQLVKDRGLIADFEHVGGRRRYDFVVLFSLEPRVAGAIEVKGGEGNSITISDRESWASEFIAWCHLDGSISNPPSHGARAIVLTRLAGDLVERGKLVDCLIIKDRLCGTRARPCPKYPGREANIGLQGAPCVFLLPRSKPTPGIPKPPIHDQSSLRLPFWILDAYGVPVEEWVQHLYHVHISLEYSAAAKGKQKRWRRRTQVYRLGEKLEDRLTVVRKHLDPPA